jgi:hypothetical protein
LKNLRVSWGVAGFSPELGRDQPSYPPTVHSQKPVLEKLTLKFFKYYEIIHGSSWRVMDNNGAIFKKLHLIEHSQIPCVWSTYSGVKIWKKGGYREQIATRNSFHELCFYYNFILLVKPSSEIIIFTIKKI